MAVREYLVFTGSQIANEVVRDYVDPALPTLGFPGLFKVVLGGVGLFASDRFLTGDLKTAGYIVSAGMLARGLMELFKGFVGAPAVKAPAPVAVAPPVAPAPAFY
ncbi:MAG: hypothetical protein QXI49_05260 [Candidatus Methanomethylicaceae archaeon]